MKGCRLIQDFIIPSLRNKTFGEHLKWDPKDPTVFMLWWVHKARSSWSENDAAVFLAWDKLKNRIRPKTPLDFVNSKQRLRAALRNVKTVQELKVCKGYRRYKILAMDGITSPGPKRKVKNEVDVKSPSLDNISKNKNNEHQSNRKTSCKIKSEIKTESDDVCASDRIYLNLRSKKRIVYTEDFSYSEESNDSQVATRRKTKVIVKTIKKEHETSQHFKCMENKVMDKRTTESNFFKSLVARRKEMAVASNVSGNEQNMNIVQPSKLVTNNDVFQDQHGTKEHSENGCKTEIPFTADCKSMIPDFDSCKSAVPDFEDCKSKIPDIENYKSKILDSGDCKSKIPNIEDCKSKIPDTDGYELNIEDFDECKSNTSDFSKATESGMQNSTSVVWNSIVAPTLTQRIWQLKPASHSQTVEKDKPNVNDNIIKDSNTAVFLFEQVKLIDGQVSKGNLGDRHKPRKNRKKSQMRKIKIQSDERIEVNIRGFEIGAKVENLRKEDNFMLGLWPNYKWDPKKEPLPNFYNPELELIELLEYWIHEYANPQSMKEFDAYLKILNIKEIHNIFSCENS